MRTTAVFAEILTVGLQALAWMALGAYVILRPDYVPSAGNWTGLITVVILTLAYTIGVIVDRVADSLLTWVERKWQNLRNKEIIKSETSFGEMRLHVRLEGGDMATVLDYTRSRLRVVRSTSLNIIPTAIFLCMLVTDTTARLAIVGIAVLALVLTVYTWIRIRKVYDKRLKKAFKLVRPASRK